MSIRARIACLTTVLIGVHLLFSPVARAAVVYTVDSNADEIDDDTSDGVCHTAAGSCTLRAAVMQANKVTGPGATIMVPADTYTLVRPASGPNGGNLSLTTPEIGSPFITIVGAGAAVTIVDANQIDRVLTVASGRTSTITGMTLRNGLTMSAGGGIYLAGTLALEGVVVRDNGADGSGGGIANDYGSLTLNHVSVSGNHALDGGGVATAGAFVASYSIIDGNQALDSGGGVLSGGGITTLDHTTLSGNSAGHGGGAYVTGATLRLQRSTVAGNLAGEGGGVAVDASSQLVVVESTLSTNSAQGVGGGLYNAGTANFYNATIVFNQASAGSSNNGNSGGGIFNYFATVNLRNSVVAGNRLFAATDYNDCTGSIGIFRNNKFWNSDGCTAAPGSMGSSTYLTTLAELGPLQNNGGPTSTHAIIAPSGMIDGADAGVGCIGPDSMPLLTDQRDAPRIAGVGCDIGAVEYGSYPDPIFADGFD